MTTRNKLIIVAASAFLSLMAASQATVITFEDLSGQGVLPSNYHGLTWTNWNYYDFLNRRTIPNLVSKESTTHLVLHR